MIRKVFKHTKDNVVLFAAVVLSCFILTACGGGGGGSSDSYDEPTGTTTDSVLIDATTLKTWIDAGYVHAGDFNQVVILDYGSDNTQGWIPGAVTVGTNEARQTRIEGVAWAASLVGTGEQMDSLIQRAGIDANTTIVITTNGNAYLSTRLYWTLRYWGFPKSQLKVLDGGNRAYDALYDMSYEDASPAASSYSVSKNIAGLQDQLRASIGEVIVDVVPDNGETQLTIDCRGATGYNGGTATLGYLDNILGISSSHRTVMEGHVAGGTYIAPTFFNADGTFFNVEALETFTLGDGVTTLGDLADYDKVTVYCTSGYGAARVFFVLDALLGVNVQLYDGSMSQWMQYAAVETDADTDGYDDNTGAGLPAGSAWSVESVTDVGGVAGSGPNYNATDNGVALDSIEEIRYLTEEAADFPSPDLVPNQVEEEDADYMESGGTSTSTVSPYDDNGAAGC